MTTPQSSEIIAAVPTTIITGFLGVGKTSAILHLLKTKQDNERWAVLVNEFGEIGIDGSLFEGQHDETSGVFIREVPGGCMCCTAGLPMQIALNQLLRKARPTRLLIEPTGLGHPKEVLEVLLSNSYKNILNIQKIITLVDARNLTDTRYTSNETFNQQIAIADTVVGNKTDLYDKPHKALLSDYVSQHARPNVELLFTQNGEIPLMNLDGDSASALRHNVLDDSHHNHNHDHLSEQRPLATDIPLPSNSYIKAHNQSEGFYSVGWRISPTITFCKDKLFTFLTGIRAERLKAVFITDQGVMGYNMAADTLTEIELDDCLESQIEIITDQSSDDETWEPGLLACALSDTKPQPVHR